MATRSTSIADSVTTTGLSLTYPSTGVSLIVHPGIIPGYIRLIILSNRMFFLRYEGFSSLLKWLVPFGRYCRYRT